MSAGKKSHNDRSEGKWCGIASVRENLLVPGELLPPVPAVGCLRMAARATGHLAQTAQSAKLLASDPLPLGSPGREDRED